MQTIEPEPRKPRLRLAIFVVALSGDVLVLRGGGLVGIYSERTEQLAQVEKHLPPVGPCERVMGHP